MAECDWAILCDYAFNDSAGKNCLIGIFDRINVPGVPAAHNSAALVLKVSGKPREQVAIRVEIVRPTGQGLAKLDGSGTLGDNGTAAVQLQLMNLPLPDYGTYAINVYLDDELSARTGFVVDHPPVGAPN